MVGSRSPASPAIPHENGKLLSRGFAREKVGRSRTADLPPYLSALALAVYDVVVIPDKRAALPLKCPTDQTDVYRRLGQRIYEAFRAGEHRG